MSTVQFSIIICTYNRSHLLRSAVESVLKQNFDKETYEIIIVDNNSDDLTREVVEEIRRHSYNCEILYVLERQQGLSFARNAGAEAATGQIVAYIDDDSTADVAWLDELARAFESNPGVSCIGGRLFADWVEGKPEWAEGTVLGVTQYDLGDEDLEIVPPQFFVGGNFAVYREVLLGIGGFSTNLGVKAKRRVCNEEIDLFHRLHEAGYKTMYAAKAIVFHKAFKKKFTRIFAWKRFYWQGRSDVILHEKRKPLDRRGHLGIAITAMKDKLVPHIKAFLKELFAKHACSVEIYIMIAYYAGFCLENIRLSLLSDSSKS